MQTIYVNTVHLNPVCKLLTILKTTTLTCAHSQFISSHVQLSRITDVYVGRNSVPAGYINDTKYLRRQYFDGEQS